MSKNHSEKIKCAKCGNTHDFTVWDSVNVTMVSGEKERILDNSFFTDRCPECGNETQILYPCLYHDMEKKVMLYLLPAYQKGTPEELFEMTRGMERAGMDLGPGYRLRAVRDVNDLKEKIYILDAGLDDRYVEIMKVFHLINFAEQHPDVELKAAYFCIDEGKSLFLLIPESGDGSYSIPFGASLYDMIGQKYEEEAASATPAGFSMIDGDWAITVMRRQAGETD